MPTIDRWIAERVAPKCTDLELHVEIRHRQRDRESIPDFVVYSSGESAAVVMDATTPQGTMRTDQVTEFRRDLKMLARDEGVSISMGIIFYDADTHVTSRAKEEGRRVDPPIYFVNHTETQSVEVAQMIYDKFYSPDSADSEPDSEPDSESEVDSEALLEALEASGELFDGTCCWTGALRRTRDFEQEDKELNVAVGAIADMAIHFTKSFLGDFTGVLGILGDLKSVVMTMNYTSKPSSVTQRDEGTGQYAILIIERQSSSKDVKVSLFGAKKYKAKVNIKFYRVQAKNDEARAKCQKLVNAAAEDLVGELEKLQIF